MNWQEQEAGQRARRRRTAIAVFAVFLLGLGVFMARDKQLEVRQKRAQLAAEEARLDRLRTTRDSLRDWKTALETDAWAVEEAIRRKLHWVRPGERVLTWEVAQPHPEGETVSPGER